MALYFLALQGLGVLNYENDYVSGERYVVRKWLPRTLRRDAMVFFDVGANVGNYARQLIGQFPSATVHAFEPHPDTYKRLVENVALATRVNCHNMALGSAQGSLNLYDRQGHGGSEHASLHKDTITDFHGQQADVHSVNVETLDGFTARHDIDYIDFLKIDTEGHELSVLEGASRLLKDRRIGPIQFEFNALNVYSRAFLLDFRKLLVGYRFYRLLPDGLLPLDGNVTTTEIFAFQNILAVRTTA